MKLTRAALKQIIKEELEEVMSSITSPIDRFLQLVGGTPDNPREMDLETALENMPTEHERDVIFQFLNKNSETYQQGQGGYFKANPKMWEQWRKMRIAGGHPDPAKSMKPVGENKKRR